MLTEFITIHRSEIVARCNEMGRAAVGDASTTDLVSPLEAILTIVEKGLRSDSAENFLFEENHEAASEAVEHGKRRASLGVDVAQVARDYGIVCDSVSSLAREYGLEMSVEEYRRMNLAIDGGISASLKAFEACRQNEQQQASSHNIGSFVHEVRNALSGATLACEILSSGRVGLGGKTARILERSLNRMERMMTQLATRVILDASPEPLVETLIFDELVEESIDTVIGTRRSRIEVDKGDNLESLRVRGDRHLAVSAISNVIQNALKYSPAEKRVMLRLRGTRRSQTATIEVQDFGPGICSIAQKKLFAPFVRGIHNKSGLGLGLSIIRHAMEAQGGKIMLESGGDNGTTFTLQFQTAE